jgi:hypothetical protein
MEAYRRNFMEVHTRIYSENTQGKVKMFLTGCGGMHWNHLAQDKIKQRDRVDRK